MSDVEALARQFEAHHNEVKALFGEIPLRGRLPVSIPGYGKIGDGIQQENLHD